MSQCPDAFSNLSSYAATDQIINRRMDTAPDAGDPRLISGVVIRGPLQCDRLRRAVFKFKSVVRITAEAAREEVRASKRGQDFGGGAAKGAVARKVAWEGGSDEVRLLVRHPIIGMHPCHAAVLGEG